MVDNRKFGGFALGIQKDGTLRGFGVNNKGKIIDCFGADKKEIKKIESIPCIQEVWETARKAATHHYHARLLGFDMTVDNQNKIRIIEVNTSDLGIDNIQQANGALFHEFTDEIIDYVIMN